jgi:hypothetical protein
MDVPAGSRSLARSGQGHLDRVPQLCILLPKIAGASRPLRLGAGTQRIQEEFDLRTVWLAHSHQAPESSFQPGVLALSRETR